MCQHQRREFASRNRVAAALPFVFGIALASVAPAPAEAATVGMVADYWTSSVTVFDTDSGAVLGSIDVGSGGAVGDCSITPDQRLGFVTDFLSQVWVVDLSASPPALARPNPIVISNPAEDTVLTPDGRYLLVCDGLPSSPISVVDVGTLTEVSTLYLDSNCSSIEVCSDGSVLALSSNSGDLHRLVLDPDGRLAHSGERSWTGSFARFGPNNVLCAPNAKSAIVVRRTEPASMMSFVVPGLVPVDTRYLSGSGPAISADGGQGVVYARTAGGAVDAFDFDAATGALGATPRYGLSAGSAIDFVGIDQLALGPDGLRLYVPNPGGVDVFDAATGIWSSSIQHPSLVMPTGICFARPVPPRCGDGTVDDGEECDDGNEADGDGCSSVCVVENQPPDCAHAAPSRTILSPPTGQAQPVGVGGVTDADGDAVVIRITAVHQDEPMSGRGRETCPSAVGLGGSSVSLQAVRQNGGDGRVYHVSFEADDARGASCSGVVAVCVPPVAKGPKAVCGDQGPLFDATGPCA